MASNLDKGFTIEHVYTGRKRISCRDCNYYELSDRSCLKTPRVFPESGYDSYKYCKYFVLDVNADFYDEKLKKVPNNRNGNMRNSDNISKEKTLQKNSIKVVKKPRASLCDKKIQISDNTLSDEEFKSFELVISSEKAPKNAVYKYLKIYLDNGKMKQIQIGIDGEKAYLSNQYPQIYIDEVIRINKKKKV